MMVGTSGQAAAHQIEQEGEAARAVLQAGHISAFTVGFLPAARLGEQGDTERNTAMVFVIPPLGLNEKLRWRSTLALQVISTEE